MAPLARRTTAPAAEEGNFGSQAFYSGGFDIPEGKHALEFNVIYEKDYKTGQVKANARLGMEITAHPLSGGEPVAKFLSMGTKAHLSWAPNSNTGKGIVKLPDGANAPLSNKSNWSLFLDSLYNTGLPENVFTNDVSVLDGMHAQIANVPEPEERKGFGSGAATGEVVEDRKPGKLPIVTEILDGGKPWEGTGGFPEAGKPAVKAPAKLTAPARQTLKAPIQPPPNAEPAGDVDGKEAAETAIATVLSEKANVNGMKKIMLRTACFKVLSENFEPDVVQAAASLMSNDDDLNGLLGGAGYALVGNDVKRSA